MAGRRIAILVPALNEADTIGGVVAGAVDHGHVIVIDNGSTDGTADHARRAGAEVIRLERPGYDAALNAGFCHAQAQGFDRVLTMDADGQHDPSDIPRFVDRLDRGSAAVAGARTGPRRLAEVAFGWIGQRLWGIRDPWCGMKAYRMEVYRQRGWFDSCRSVGSELLLFAARAGMPVGEVRIEVRPRADVPRFGNRVRANGTLFAAMLRVLLATGAHRGAEDNAG